MTEPTPLPQSVSTEAAFKPPLFKQQSTNLAVLPLDALLTNIYKSIKENFSEDIAKELDTYIRENEFDLEQLRDDIEILEDSFLISEIAQRFGWDNNIKQQSRFRLILQNVLNPQISSLTRMKCLIARDNIPSELLVCGFLRDFGDDDEFSSDDDEDEQSEENNNFSDLGDLSPFKYTRSQTMTLVPDGVMRLCVRYYQVWINILCGFFYDVHVILSN